MKRIGLAGLGRMGQRYLQHVRPESILVNSRPVRGGQSNSVFYRAMGLSPNPWLSGIDLVIIATPAATHADLVCAALEAGKPTLCEKPLCTTREELARIREVWERTGTPLLVDHTHLWHPEIVMKHRWVRDGEFGDGGGKVNYYASFGDPSDEWKWDWLEWSPHPISIALACGYPENSTGFEIQRGAFTARSRSFSAISPYQRFPPVYYNGDTPCTPTPLARVVDDFVNQRIDWRWNEFGFRVMELVLEGMNQ